MLPVDVTLLAYVVGLVVVTAVLAVLQMGPLKNSLEARVAATLSGQLAAIVEHMLAQAMPGAGSRGGGEAGGGETMQLGGGQMDSPVAGLEQVAFGPLVWLPLWQQDSGVLPDGNADPQQYNDCGETCVAMVVAAVKGVCVEPGAFRQALGGPARTGLTTGGDLVQALAWAHVLASAIVVVAPSAAMLIRDAWVNARPCIVLGRWGPGGSLHWMVTRGYASGTVTFIDPWTGTVRNLSAFEFSSMYANSMVEVQAHLHYDMSQTGTPGT